MAALKQTKALSLLLLAVLAALGASACGPMADNLPKGIVHQSDDHSAPPSLLATDPSATLSEEDDDAQALPVEETQFLGHQAFNRLINDSTYRSVPAAQRIEISDLSALRRENGSLTLSPSGFLSGDEGGKIIVVVDMNRPASSIPARDYLPQARLTVAASEHGGSSPILTLSFSDVQDPAADTTEELLEDAARIYIYRR